MGRSTIFTLSVAAVVTGLAASPSGANDTMLTPSSQWSVDFAPKKCRLARTFGEGEDRHLLFIEQYGPSRTFGLTVAGSSLKRFRSLRRTRMTFFDGQELKPTEPFKGDVDGFGDAVIYSSISLEAGDESLTDDDEPSAGLPQLDPEFADKVEYVALRQGNRKVHLATGALGEAFKILNQCTQDIVKSWGLDAEKHLTATSMPEWINQDAVVRRIAGKYPAKALNRGEQGIFRMRVIVAEDGSVSDCVVNNATVQDRLESPACKEMAKAKFRPALDADGKPFPSYFATSITYRVN